MTPSQVHRLCSAVWKDVFELWVGHTWKEASTTDLQAFWFACLERLTNTTVSLGWNNLRSRRELNQGSSQCVAMLSLSSDVYSQTLTFILLFIWTLIWGGWRLSEHFSFHNVPLSLNWVFLWGNSCFIVVIFITTFSFFYLLLSSHPSSSYPLLPSPPAITNWL